MGRTARTRSVRPRLEGLEDRRLLYATTGGLFSRPARITYSFVPDGTSVGGIPSNLMGTLDAKFARQTWEDQFRKAAATWQAVTGINVDEVSDDGSAIGVAGNQQNDPRFGDVRIGGYPMAATNLALCFAPPPFNGGTLASDVFFNTNRSWQINTDYDLLTVAIHEVGHALGMAHSTIATADMYGTYGGLRQSLTTDDTQGIQTIYGTRPLDGDNTTGTATNLTGLLDPSGQVTVTGPDISSNSDVDWFYVVAPASTTGTLTVRMQSDGLSSLSPKVVVYNAALQGLASAAAANTYGSTVTLSLSGVHAGQGFYIKAMPANSGPTGTGAFALQLNFGPNPLPAVSPPDTTVAQQPDQGGGSLALALGRIEIVSVGRLTAFGDDLEAPARRGPHRRPHATLHPKGPTPRRASHPRSPKPPTDP